MVHAKTAAAERLHRRRQSRAMRRRWRDPESRRAYSKALKKTASSREGRRIRAEVARRGWDDPVVRKRRVEALKAAWERDHERRAPLSRKAMEVARERVRTMSEDERLEHSRRLSEGQRASWVRRRAAGPVRVQSDMGADEDRVGRGRDQEAPSKRSRTAPPFNPVNELARRIAAEAALPADAALTVASIAMGVGPS